MNAKKEFLQTTKGIKVIAAKIEFDSYKFSDRKVLLYKNYDKQQFDKFLENINVEYDCGYGGQELFGEIWCENGIWFDRFEYDGSESWERHKYPNGMPTLLNNDRRVKLERLLDETKK